MCVSHDSKLPFAWEYAVCSCRDDNILFMSDGLSEVNELSVPPAKIILSISVIKEESVLRNGFKSALA
jgi:hypothetical protein